MSFFRFDAAFSVVGFNAAFYPSWDQDLADKLLDDLDLPRDRKLSSLSRGMQAKVGLVMALGPRPELLILNGNGGRSAWAMVERKFGISVSRPPVDLGRNFRLKEGCVLTGPFAGARVIGLPHLSREKASANLLGPLANGRDAVSR